MKIISRKDAKTQGLKHYFTGEPCKHGHVAERYTCGGKCMECRNEYQKQYSKDNAEKIAEQKKQYYKDNAEKLNERSKQYYKDNAEQKKQYYKDNAEKIAKRMKQYSKDNAEKHKQYQKQYYKDNAEQKKQYYKDNAEQKKQYRKDNAEKIAEQKKQYRKDNAEKLNERSKQYSKDNAEKLNARLKYRYANDPKFKMACVIRSMLRRTLKSTGGAKTNRTVAMLGYTRDDLREHIEKQFTPEMTWDNYGTYWHIDHIAPLSVLIELGITDPAGINMLANLRPLEASVNLSKGNSYIG